MFIIKDKKVFASAMKASISLLAIIVCVFLLFTSSVSKKDIEEMKNEATMLVLNNYDTVSFVKTASLYTKPNYNQDQYPIGVVPCTTEIFASYNEFENFIKNTYIPETAEAILGSSYNGKQKYFNYNGELCKTNFKIIGNYPLNWSTTKMKLNNIKENFAEIVLSVEHKDSTQTSELILYMHKINNKWLLEQMVY